MRVLHFVQCARRDGNGAAGCCLHGLDDQALRKPGSRHGPDSGRRRLWAGNVIDQPIVTLNHEELVERAAIAAPQAMRHLLDR